MDRLLVQQEAAEYLRVSQRTLERWRVAGTTPAYIKAGRRVLYRECDLEDWIAKRVVNSTSEASCLKS